MSFPDSRYKWFWPPGLYDALLLIYNTLKGISNKMTALDDAITKLESDVTAETTVDQSAITLLNGISQQLKDILAATGDPAAQLARVQALQTALEADTANLGAAVSANTTPPAPAPVP